MFHCTPSVSFCCHFVVNKRFVHIVLSVYLLTLTETTELQIERHTHYRNTLLTHICYV